MSDMTTQQWTPSTEAQPKDQIPTLVLLAFPHNPGRVGEAAHLTPGEWTLGRQGTLPWAQHRPGRLHTTGPLDDPTLSRVQAAIQVLGGKVHLTNRGRLPMTLNGLPAQECVLQPGDLIALGDRALLRFSLRAPLSQTLLREAPFGQPDRSGWVGESPVSWALRERLTFVAARQVHVLVTGPSGSGKELVARAIHSASPRAKHPMVSRNAATIPESLADAELFGHVRGYPNAGMPARLGLIGEADGGTLFLDEFGELPEAIQARLLRVADSGEYSRLGEARQRQADLRLIAATNRDPASLKHDMRARFPIHVIVPSLADRIDDIPLIAMHLLRQMAQADDGLRNVLFPPGPYSPDRPSPHPQLTVRLVQHLVTHRYHTHVRELSSILWSAVQHAQHGILDQVGPDVFGTLQPSHPTGPVDPSRLDPQLIQATLDKHGGQQEPVWKELGLSSRHVLARLVKKHGLRVRRRG